MHRRNKGSLGSGGASLRQQVLNANHFQKNQMEQKAAVVQMAEEFETLAGNKDLPVSFRVTAKWFQTVLEGFSKEASHVSTLSNEWNILAMRANIILGSQVIPWLYKYQRTIPNEYGKLIQLAGMSQADCRTIIFRAEDKDHTPKAYSISSDAYVGDVEYDTPENDMTLETVVALQCAQQLGNKLAALLDAVNSISSPAKTAKELKNLQKIVLGIKKDPMIITVEQLVLAVRRVYPAIQKEVKLASVTLNKQDNSFTKMLNNVKGLLDIFPDSDSIPSNNFNSLTKIPITRRAARIYNL